jgi:hypothetical protein
MQSLGSRSGCPAAIHDAPACGRTVNGPNSTSSGPNPHVHRRDGVAGIKIR